ncbi:MAG TPA: flagellar hook capping FlgD N-terminal domain-containing protein [Bryobacteraceae bacterium]|nr:flagellar hook capping FlgD N-terminal domain-containing protein [Bryobacteraceae bacterium]
MIVNSTSNTVNSASSPAASTSAAATAASATSGLANEQVFLQLLVAQLQKQDPTQPTDPMQFVSELAQFSSLEQEVQMRQDLDKINTDTAPSSGTSSTPPTKTT